MPNAPYNSQVWFFIYKSGVFELHCGWIQEKLPRYSVITESLAVNKLTYIVGNNNIFNSKQEIQEFIVNNF